MIRFTRHGVDGSSEVLTICQLDEGTLYSEALGVESPYVVQVTSGPEPGDDFVGLYDLDGERIDWSSSWEIVEDVPTEVIEAVREGWATGETVVEDLDQAGGAEEDVPGRPPPPDLTGLSGDEALKAVTQWEEDLKAWAASWAASEEQAGGALYLVEDGEATLCSSDDQRGHGEPGVDWVRVRASSASAAVARADAYDRDSSPRWTEGGGPLVAR